MPETLSATQESTERLALSTAGEIKDWLGKVSPTSPESTVFLDGMRTLIDDAAAQEDRESARTTETAALILAGAIGQKSEEAFQRKVTAGLDASREVTDGNILAATVEFNPDHPSFKGYTDSAEVFAVAQALDQIVRQEVPGAYQS